MVGTFETFGRYLDRCESPLERRFLRALLFSEMFGFRPVLGRGPVEIAEDDEGLVLGQQVRVGAYRIDFAMKRSGSRRRLAIELDGRSFHTTPQQVERDKVRDRVLLGCDWTTVRFSYKEVIQDAMGCAWQARDLALRFDDGAAPAARLARALVPVNQAGQGLLVANARPILSTG